ncbi:hypothetical protein QE152_g38201 [Popillia japonica]|uniref:Transposase n=1 Tax=Popillia japonica TaxID=7064 RepID=A0AAW1I889_POPJA
MFKIILNEKKKIRHLCYLSLQYNMVTAAVGISRKTLYSINRRKEQDPVLRSPGKKWPRGKAKTSDLSDSAKMAVRDTMYMYKDRKHVTLRSLNAELQAKQIVHMSKSSLAILLKDLGFKYKHDDNRRALMERLEIACMRSVFLRKYMENQNSEHPREVATIHRLYMYVRVELTFQLLWKYVHFSPSIPRYGPELDCFRDTTGGLCDIFFHSVPTVKRIPRYGPELDCFRDTTGGLCDIFFHSVPTVKRSPRCFKRRRCQVVNFPILASGVIGHGAPRRGRPHHSSLGPSLIRCLSLFLPQA